MPLWYIFFALLNKGLEGETVQSGLPVDVRDRGRPSAQFARESSPAASTKKTVFDGLFFILSKLVRTRTHLAQFILFALS